MTAIKSFKDFKACLLRRLAPIGFAVAGDILFRKVRDTVLVLEIQKDRKCSTRDEIRFTINLGLSIDVLRAIASADGSASGVPSPEKCHWRARLGHLLLGESDVWWSVRDEQTARAVCDEIATGLIDAALPKVEAVASSESLATLWEEGRGQGLTEYERRTNLARLLCALNRTEEAKAAIQALEDASLGKSWEVSAKYDAIDLRKQIA
ncbi:MAG: DUF4304 domain-containing protein [Sulfuritalea sp.]|nr:DUF4304 domain-containing protein [Sulfuritalea sp.]